MIETIIMGRVAKISFEVLYSIKLARSGAYERALDTLKSADIIHGIIILIVKGKKMLKGDIGALLRKYSDSKFAKLYIMAELFKEFRGIFVIENPIDSGKNYMNEALYIDKKFSGKKDLKKITVNKIEAPTMSGEDIDKIIEFLQDKLGVKYHEKKEEEKISEESQEIMQEIKDVKAEKLADVDFISSQITEESEYRTKIIKNNLRSGVSVNYDGNILVIGDVNAGAELVATGNIIVIGVLRGFANAGVKGDRSAMVISNKINATQLRIGQLIAIPPKDDDKKTTGVQIASIQNNKIEIQQY